MNVADSSGWDPKLKSPAIEAKGGSFRTLCTFKTSFGTATVIDGIPPQEYETWVAGFENYTFDHRYYEIVHESLKAQFDHYYLFLRDTDGMTRAIQPFLGVTQDVAAGTPEFVRNALLQVRRAIRQFLNLRMLMLGCPAAEGDNCFGQSESQRQLDGRCAEGEPGSCRSQAEGSSDRIQGLPETLPRTSR